MLELPLHPATGLAAVGVLPSGRIVWPVLGASDQGDAGGDADGQAEGSGSGDDAGGRDSGKTDGQQTFRQADIDRIVAERLSRERSKYADYDQLRGKAQELDQLKESQASDTEKALNQARKDTEAAIRGQLEPRMARLEAALRHGLPPEVAARVLSASKRLVGDTPEELDADAKEFFGSTQLAPAGSGGTGFDQGTRTNGGATKPSVTSGADLYAQRRGKK